MIVKSLRHSTPYFGYIVNYLFDGRTKQEDFDWIEYRNLSSGADRESVISEFEENVQYLKQRTNLSRKKTFKYHEILAFSKESIPHLTKDKLQKIASKYIRLRDPENSALAICIPHFEKGKLIHLHFLFSSNHVMSKKSSDMRMNNAFYYDLRRSIERYTLKSFPELHHSTVYLDKKELLKLLPPEMAEERKNFESKQKNFGNQSKKQFVANTVRAIVDESNSLNDFERRVNNEDGFETYSRKGVLTGVIRDGRKYRFKTLGIQLVQENMKVLERLGELKNIEHKQKSKGDKSMER